MNIKQIIEKTDTKSGKIFDLFIQALIILSLIAFSTETLPNLSDQSRRWLRLFEIFSVSIFTAEYLARFLVADKKTGFVFSFFGIVDLLAIIPFYLSIGVDLRSIRVFRLFRLFRAFKFLRYSKAIRRFKIAFTSIKEELILFSIATLFVLYLSAVGIYYFENKAQPEQFASVFHALWWAVITMTTVGYGDVYPITAGGRFFTFIMLMLSLGIIAIPTGLIASSLTKVISEEKES